MLDNSVRLTSSQPLAYSDQAALTLEPHWAAGQKLEQTPWSTER